MKTRAITALFFVLAMLSSFFFGPLFFSLFYLVLASACLFEFYGMFGKEQAKPNQLLGVALGFLGFGAVICDVLDVFRIQLSPLFLIAIMLVFLEQLYKKAEKPFLNIANTLLGFSYVILPFACFFLLSFRQEVFFWQLPFGFFLLLWANDTGAYLTGRAFGRNKLFERISPKKTWEGFAGGILSAILVGISLFNYVGVLALWQWLSVAVLIGVVGTLGDLVESMLKRSLQVKDSGKLLPGHGGLLDRFDGLLLAAPAVYLFLTYFS